ncbi:MAG: DUF4114 domain-containing protein [Spirochaetaceae bacterium]|nr:DUF4114 domain-containing protein [Spirochaetaceae bacterium]MCF7947162.1 DUF4114 domain-containing protein [Spirochaetia bacterium]MCF7950027.1 DUF4114 domain-containing protein [Spirochaetaceae bacterium]
MENMNTGTNIHHVLMHILNLFLLLPLALSAGEVTAGIRMGLQSGIVAHPTGEDIVMEVSPFTSAETDVTARGNGFLGYFDSNVRTTITYQGNSLHHGDEPHTDVMSTRYHVRLYGHGSGDVNYRSPTVEDERIEWLPGSSVVEPNTGKIYVDLEVEADVDWSHGIGQYEAVFVLTATKSGGMSEEDIERYSSVFSESNQPHDVLIAPETSPNLSLSEDVEIMTTFIEETAGYRNTIGYFLFPEEPLVDIGEIETSSKVLYENASMENSGEELIPGDSRDLGLFESEFDLGFWIASDGYKRTNPEVYYSIDEYNADGLRHVSIFSDLAQNRIVVGFEDLPGGGDKDYNDVLIGLDIYPFSAVDLDNIPDISELRE